MYPVAPASLILFVKRISDLLAVDNSSIVRTNLLRLMKAHNQTGGWLSGQTKPYPPFNDSYETRAGVVLPTF